MCRRKSLTHVAAAAALSLLAALLVATSATSAAASTARVPPASVQGDCDTDTVPVVVASDLAAQSDIYSAVTLAGVLGDACIVLAGHRSEAMSAAQQSRLDAAASGGYVVGGLAAVPDGKIAGRTMARLGGADRWATALLVGEEAANPGSAPRTSVAADEEFISMPGASTGSAATRVRVPPASVQRDCDSDTTPVVVASDLAAQSDIYSAVTLAGVLGEACIVLAGPRGESMPAVQQTRLESAASGGYVVGGLAAVPDEKIAGRAMARLGGADRWATALMVGEEAAADGPESAEGSEADTTATSEPEPRVRVVDVELRRWNHQALIDLPLWAHCPPEPEPDWLRAWMDEYRSVWNGWADEVVEVDGWHVASGWWNDEQIGRWMPDGDVTAAMAYEHAVYHPIADTVSLWPVTLMPTAMPIESPPNQLPTLTAALRHRGHSIDSFADLLRATSRGVAGAGAWPDSIDVGKLLTSWVRFRASQPPTIHEPVAWPLRSLFDARESGCAAEALIAMCASEQTPPAVLAPEHPIGRVLRSLACGE